MGAETKAQAHRKLKNFRVKIGYPNKWRDYSKLEIKDGDLIGNLRRTNGFTMTSRWINWANRLTVKNGICCRKR